MSEEILEHDEWYYGLQKLPKAPKIELGPIYGILAFDGVRDPGSRSATSHHSWFAYQTWANDWQRKVGITESDAELACAHEALIDPTTYDVAFQPLAVHFIDEDGRNRTYTHDLLITRQDGHRRFVFVRNEESLSKPRTWREIEAVVAATPATAADDLIVVNAGDYTRQRRENLRRLHAMTFQPDEEADEIVLWTARRLRTLWLMEDLFPHAGIEQARVFRSCHRLVAKRQLQTDLDQVFWEKSQLAVAA